jgi:predicted oxidoreductase (fatty acid repression mutant protein)
MILLTNDAEKKLWRIREQLLEEPKVTSSNDFQQFSNLVENLSVRVENVGKMSQFTNKIVIRELLKKLPEYLRLQWTHDVNIQQFTDWVSALKIKKYPLVEESIAGTIGADCPVIPFC